MAVARQNKHGMIAQADARHIPLADGIIDMVITDPPYAVLKHESLTRGMAKPITRYMKWDDMTIPQWYRLMRDSLLEIARISRQGATIYCFCAGELTTLLKGAGEKAGLTWHMANFWHKLNPAPKIYLTTPQSSVEIFGMFTKGRNQTFNAKNGGLCHNFFEYPMPTGNSRIHPTQKPLELMIDLIERSSNHGDFIIDPFCGSGVVGEACRITGRHFWLGDTNWRYVRDMAAFKAFNRASSKAVLDTPLFANLRV